jgi:NAD(P)-dependent dehydrogenase (short-subunit alcohol dehydrogenase family)
VPCDAEDVSALQRLVAEAVARFGRLDCLFANHAIMAHDWILRDSNPVDIEFEVWDRTIAVNARGYLAAAKYAIPHMLSGGGGAIVFTSSGSGSLGDVANIAYGASKAAVNSLTRYIATMYGKKNIRCNAVSPGLIRSQGGMKNVFGPMVDIMAANTLTPRLGQPADVAAMAVYLCSADAEFITGQVLPVDGGMSAHQPYYSDLMSGNIRWDS